MVVHVLLTRIFIDGGILTAFVALVAVGMLYFNPRIALSDYPEDVKAAVPPRTKKELQLGIILSVPFLVVGIALPLYSVWLLKQQSGGQLSYGVAWLTIFDLLVLDLWMFYSWTPKFLVLPGTEGMAGYKDFRPHLKAQLTLGNLGLAAFAAILALVPTFFF